MPPGNRKVLGTGVLGLGVIGSWVKASKALGLGGFTDKGFRVHFGLRVLGFGGLRWPQESCRRLFTAFCGV